MAAFSPLYLLHKLAYYTAERFISYVHPAGAAEYWLPITAAATIAAVYLTWRLRLSVVFMVLAALVVPVVVAQLMTGNCALLTIPRELYGLLVSFLLLLGIIALWRVADRKAWCLLAMVYAAHIPVLYLIGPHYWYWPAAFWALFSSYLGSLVCERLMTVPIERPRAAAA